MNKVESWNGRFFEDFAIGDVFESRLGRTITETDNIWFTLLSNNTNQAHFNVEYAKASGLPNMIVNSALSLAIVAGLSVTDVSENGYNLGWTSIELPEPLFPGDTVFARSEVLDLRESKSRPHMGIVTIRTEGLNQHGTCAVRYGRSILTWKRAHAPATRSFSSDRISSDAAPIFSTSPAKPTVGQRAPGGMHS